MGGQTHQADIKKEEGAAAENTAETATTETANAETTETATETETENTAPQPAAEDKGEGEE